MALVHFTVFVTVSDVNIVMSDAAQKAYFLF